MRKIAETLLNNAAPTITTKVFDELVTARNHLNKELFEGKLPDALIIFVRKPHMRGHFADNRYSGRVDPLSVPEIALNPDSFVDRTDAQIISTLAHEMVHLQQRCFGTPSKHGYHNKEWAAMMWAIGLAPSNTGAIGGRETGSQMSHYILDDGPYARAFAALAKTKWRLSLQSTVYAGGARKPDESKTKFACPACGWIIRAKPDTQMVCKNCLLDALSALPWLDAAKANDLGDIVDSKTMLPPHTDTDVTASRNLEDA